MSRFRLVRLWIFGCWSLITLFGMVRPAAASPAPFDEGNTLYEAQEFGEARKRYEQLVNDGLYTPNVFFNLGNTEYRLGHTGRAILAYERTLLLDPVHPEAQANLSLLRGKAGAKTLPASSLDAILLPLSPQTYCLIAVVAAWMAIFCVAFLLLWRGFRGLLTAVCVAAVLVAGYSGAGLARERRQRAIAVVISPEVTARLEAADRSGVAETLAAGSDVRILSERGPWIYCELPGGGRGWLPRNSIERIAPGADSA